MIFNVCLSLVVDTLLKWDFFCMEKKEKSVFVNVLSIMP